MSEQPCDPPSLIELTSRMADWRRLVVLYVNAHNQAFTLSAILTPEWVNVGGWEYVAEVVEAMLDQVLTPLGIKALPELEWRVLPFGNRPDQEPKIILPRNSHPSL